MRISRRTVVAITLALVSGCGQNNDPYQGESEQKKQMLAKQRELFDQHYTQWQSAALENYNFTRSIECKCQERRDLVISVADGMVTDAYYINQGSENEGTSKEKSKKFSSIKDFFHMIDFAIKHHYDYVDASYDKDYGFPTAMNFIVNNQEKGDGVSYKIHDFNIRYTISFPPINSKPVAKASEPDSKPPATSAPGQQLQ